MSTHEESWFSARIVLECVRVDGSAFEEEFYEERILVVRANSEEDARDKVPLLKTSGGFEYENEDGVKLVWRFKEILDVKAIFDADLRDGSQVYYTFLSADQLAHVRASLTP